MTGSSLYNVEIDQNNPILFTKLTHYLHTNNFFKDEHKNFILHDIIITLNKPHMLFIPKDNITLSFEDDNIYISYTQSRTHRNSRARVIRFETIIVCSEKSLTHIQNFLTMINEIHIPEAPEMELMKFVWKEDYWNYSKTFTERDISTIYFKKKYDIINVIESFLNDASMFNIYTELNIPYKKIFLFHGLPGTGKTSTIKALASYFKHNIAIVKNVNELDDNSLEKMISTLRKKTFLVFEDIDCIFENRDVQSKTNISFSGLLNMLDGVQSYDKLVVFITTNFLNRLDFALRRRIDMFVEFGHVEKEEIIEMYNRFFKHKHDLCEQGSEFFKKIKNKKLTVNTLEKYFIECLQKNLNPHEDITFLNTYDEMTTYHGVVEHLYN